MTAFAKQFFARSRHWKGLIAFLMTIAVCEFLTSECHAGVMLPATQETHQVIADLNRDLDFQRGETRTSTRLDALVAGIRARTEQERPTVPANDGRSVSETSGGTSNPLVSATCQSTFIACASCMEEAPVRSISCFTGRMREWALLLPEAPCEEMLDPPRV